MDLRIKIKVTEDLATLALLKQGKNFRLFGWLKILEHFRNSGRVIIGEEIDQVSGLAVPDDFSQVRNQQRIPHRFSLQIKSFSELLASKHRHLARYRFHGQDLAPMTDLPMKGTKTGGTSTSPSSLW
jgi:hypothetical protein